MNFNYSYRSFLITSLLLGILILSLISIKLSSEQEDILEDTYNLVLTEEQVVEEEEELASLSEEQVKIETNRAYNEAEKFISSVENENQKITETTEGKLQEMNDALENSQNSEYGLSNVIDKSSKDKKTDFSNSKSESKDLAVVSGANRRTTISYQLKDRKDILLPNPVYTCYGSGKVVINIEVNELGKVIKTTYNKNASTTGNQCLIDSASEYAAKARFNTEAAKIRQLGSITFNFPGQR